MANQKATKLSERIRGKKSVHICPRCRKLIDGSYSDFNEHYNKCKGKK